jgi:hypothetical protein
METAKDRLRFARKQAGFKSARSAALAHGWPESTYRSHENNNAINRNYGYDDAVKYGRAFRRDPLWLLFGDRFKDRQIQQLPVIGYVGTGAVVEPVDDHLQGAGLDTIPAPPDVRDGIGLIVRGTSMMPRYNPGDIVICENIERDLTSLIGRECYIQLADGKVYVKKLRRGSEPGRFTLVSHNAEDIEDVQIVRAYPVAWVKLA